GPDCCEVDVAGYAPLIASLAEEARSAKAGTSVNLGDLNVIRGFSVRGRVLARSGGPPIAGASLLLCDDRGAGFAPANAREWGRRGDGGQFLLEHVPPTRRLPSWVLFVVAAEGIGWVELPPDAGKKDVDSIEVELAPTAVLAVHAQNSDGKPVADATLRVEP